MSVFLRLSASSFCALLLTAAARAQTAPAAPPAHSHTPAASTHAGGTVTLDQFVTSATPFARNQIDLAQSTTVLGGAALRLKQQSSLGETLSAEAGMSATSFGPGASRPIIRGLGGDRIRLLENSVGTLDASVASPDHAVSVEPFLVERIEIVRGPASLLYGSNAVGGVVNVITHRIETDLPAETVRGGAEVRFGSGANELARGGVVDFAVKPDAGRAIVFHLDGFRRSADDVRIPGFAESASIRAAETAEARAHGEPTPDFARDRLPNSGLDSESAAAGVSFVSETFHVGASTSGFNSLYGVPGHSHEAAPGDAAGVRIDLRQRRTDVQAEWHGDTGFLRGAKLKFGHARYRHAEIEPDGAIGTLFSNRGYDARLELLHGDGKPWNGAVGLQSSRSDFSAVGDEAFLPPSETRSDALFAFEEVTQGAISWQFGGRFERTRIAPEGGRSRRDEELSGSLGAVWKLDATHAIAVSLTRTGRAPNAQELFANGPHAGTQAFEIGDAALSPERSLGLEASLRRRTGFVTGAITVYANRFNGYIFEQPTGLVAVESGDTWSFVPPDSPAADAAEGGLPVYQYRQHNARFWGAELETLWHLHDQRDWQLDLRLAADFTRAREGSRPLPRIPAARFTTGLAWAHEGWSAGADAQWIMKQNRVAANETTSDGYTLVSAYVSRTLTFGATRWDVFVRGSNLANEEARPHPSFVKELAPLPGRSVTAGVRLTF
ncbi:TonB-dependent receptor [Horticoccus sp. 23ND18S-11]|uniref:TonB-dependent receptor n=1 Tax=Horticoccus sp. 23ND18S-11 TaxID=3391832 RepID=UPI0039C915B4